MPKITPETPTDSMTIEGKVFNIFQPYSAGYVINAGEADALNAAFADRMRTNMRKPIRDALDANSFDQDVFQGQISDFAENYEFGLTRSGDPIRQEAMAIAKDLVRKAFIKEGHNLKEVTIAQINERAAAAIDKNPRILEIAKERVAARMQVSDIEIEAQEPAPAPVSRKKAPADAPA